MLILYMKIRLSLVQLVLVMRSMNFINAVKNLVIPNIEKANKNNLAYNLKEFSDVFKFKTVD